MLLCDSSSFSNIRYLLVSLIVLAAFPLLGMLFCTVPLGFVKNSRIYFIENLYLFDIVLLK